MDFLAELGLEDNNPGGYCGEWITGGDASLESTAPATGRAIASIGQVTAAEYARISAAAHEPSCGGAMCRRRARGEYVRRIGHAMRELKEPLGKLVAHESGKILQEGLGEVQECIDIADFSVGLSRQLYGLTMPSERPQHSMRETWHPLGTGRDHHSFQFPGRGVGVELDAVAGPAATPISGSRRPRRR